MPRPYKLVDYPRNGADGKPIGQVAIWVLTQEEQMVCSTEAERFTRDKLKGTEINRESFGYDAVYSNEACVQILFRACRDVNDIEGRTAFPTPSHIRQNLSAAECGALFQHYLTVQAELGPLASSLTEDEMDAWIKRIAEGGSAFPFDLLPSDLQRILALSMARRLHVSSTDTSSAGSQPSDT